MEACTSLTDRQTDAEGIPLMIHYCWFGGGAKPTVFDRCLASWKRCMPGCEIVEWDESNTDLSFCPFLTEAYANKKWAFVSDVVRLKAVYDYGGIYLDTDVELYHSFDKLMKNEAFFFFQNHNQINTGLGFGAVKGHPLVKRLLDDYFNIEFSLDNLDKLACPIRNTAVAKETVLEFRANNTPQFVDGVSFLSFEEYCGLAHHYGEFSWKNEEQAAALKYAKKKRSAWKLRKVLRSPVIMGFLEKRRSHGILRAYTFLTHDLLDYGVVYWLVRVLQKVRRPRC